VPHALALYASLLENRPTVMRRFEEIADDGLRERFATFDLLLLASFLAGYLSEAGRILGREIVRAEPDSLASGWVELSERLAGDRLAIEDWERLPLDFDRWGAPRAGLPPRQTAELAENLRRNAPLAVAATPDPDLDAWAEPGARRAEEIWESSNRIWAELRSGSLEPGLEPIARRLREVGIPFREGAQMIETIALGPVQTGPVRVAG
jgi:hypothetical protein